MRDTRPCEATCISCMAHRTHTANKVRRANHVNSPDILTRSRGAHKQMTRTMMYRAGVTHRAFCVKDAHARGRSEGGGRLGGGQGECTELAAEDAAALVVVGIAGAACYDETCLCVTVCVRKKRWREEYLHHVNKGPKKKRPTE